MYFQVLYDTLPESTGLSYITRRGEDLSEIEEGWGKVRGRKGKKDKLIKDNFKGLKLK